MSDDFATVAEYREALLRMYKAVRHQAETGPNKDEAREAIPIYHRMFGIVDAMTPGERNEPFERIDAGRLHRIAQGAGAADQHVLQLLYDFREFQEVDARARFQQRRCGNG
ncbi:MAG: hypothetical protein WBC44_06505 [Planctomycetaceae bacterium]